MSPPPAAPASNDRIDVLDALRGFASLWVFFYHIWNIIYPHQSTQMEIAHLTGQESWIFYVTFFLMQYGYLGVTIFFVISGFCIHLPQARRFAKTGADGLRLGHFFRRRFWRLYPAYFAALWVACLGLGVMNWTDYHFRLGATPSDQGTLFDIFGVPLVLPSALFLQPFEPKAYGLNGPVWTLVMEVHFYLAYPILLRLTRWIGILPVALPLFACEMIMAHFSELKDQLFLSRYFEWYLGFIGAELVARRGLVLTRTTARFWCVTGILATVLTTFIAPLWPYRDLLAALTAFFGIAWLLQSVGQRQQMRNPLLSVMLWLGACSYSLYLLHVPLLRLVHAGNRFLVQWLDWPESIVPYLILDSIPIIIAFAYGFYWLFERPFLKSSKR